MTIKERVQQNAKDIAKSFKAMPKCECGHARIKHGVYCDSSCAADFCDCRKYKAREALAAMDAGQAVEEK